MTVAVEQVFGLRHLSAIDVPISNLFRTIICSTRYKRAEVLRRFIMIYLLDNLAADTCSETLEPQSLIFILDPEKQIFSFHF